MIASASRMARLAMEYEPRYSLFPETKLRVFVVPEFQPPKPRFRKKIGANSPYKTARRLLVLRAGGAVGNKASFVGD